MNCLFVETPDEKILIETGIGEKWSAKEIRNYGIFREKPFAESLFEQAGVRPDEITIVVNTHLHFDHAGGNTIRVDGTVLPQFPNARYYVSKDEFEHAENAHERDRASYLPDNWQPLIASGQLDLNPDEYDVVEGLHVERVRGHSETMQTVKLTRGGETLFGFFDMIPTRHHLPLPWIMSYDLLPAETLEFKRRIIPTALAENWIGHFYHDLDMPLCRFVEIDGKVHAVSAVQ
jgi:glyoxylase-like metal-dependent hydrolase (beta-lactamase superfamily II)